MGTVQAHQGPRKSIKQCVQVRYACVANLEGFSDPLFSNFFSHIALHELALELHQGRLDLLASQARSAAHAHAKLAHE